MDAATRARARQDRIPCSPPRPRRCKATRRGEDYLGEGEFARVFREKHKEKSGIPRHYGHNTGTSRSPGSKTPKPAIVAKDGLPPALNSRQVKPHRAKTRGRRNHLLTRRGAGKTTRRKEERQVKPHGAKTRGR